MRPTTINFRAKAHRRYLKSKGIWWMFRRYPRGRILGIHHRWWALGQYSLKYGEPCPDVFQFLSNVDFVGTKGALNWS